MNASKRKGTRGENLVVEFLQGHGFPDVERRALSGTNDKGDVAGIPGVVIEVKNTQKMLLAKWLDEVEVERQNADALIGAVVASRRLKPPGEWYVIMDLDTLTVLLKEAGY